MNSSSGFFGQKLILLTGIPWLIACIFGFSILMKYETTPGPKAEVSNKWPLSSVAYNKEHPTLVMFVHSRCSCSKASLEELSKIISNNQGKTDARVYFYAPKNADDNWSESNNWKIAKATRGVQVFEDQEGRLAAEFGAKTSGHTFLYNTSGELVFNGGITFKRGTSGKNAGSDAVTQYINENKAATAGTPVFGCEI